MVGLTTFVNLVFEWDEELSINFYLFKLLLSALIVIDIITDTIQDTDIPYQQKYWTSTSGQIAISKNIVYSNIYNNYRWEN